MDEFEMVAPNSFHAAKHYDHAKHALRVIRNVGSGSKPKANAPPKPGEWFFFGWGERERERERERG